MLCQKTFEVSGACCELFLITVRSVSTFQVLGSLLLGTHMPDVGNKIGLEQG